MPELIIATEMLDPVPSAWLSSRARLEFAGPDTPFFASVAGEAGGILIRTYTRVDADLLDRLPRLRVVGRAGVGLDNIDLPECRRRGVEVVHTPEANTQAVVEYVTALLCDALRPRLVLPGPVSLDRWHELRRDVVAERQMDTLTLGILGLGRIGRRVAEVARAIGFRVRANDVLPMAGESQRCAEPVELETLFAESDVISLHIDGRPENRGFVDRRLLSLLKPDVTLLNTCRGMVLDHDALGAHLRNHPGSQALLDVHDPEPPTPDHPLWDLPNAHLLPHLASRTRQATENMSWVVKDVVAVLEGRQPRWPAIEPGHPER
jgi:phosphoglycerate dehydrogenase-like enzyme